MASYTRIFQPDRPGNYYLETVSPDGQCVSGERSGVTVKEVFQPFSMVEELTCSLDFIGTWDTLFISHPYGCDSLVITYYRFNDELQEVIDTQLVCTVLDTGRVKTYDYQDNCPIRLITEKIYYDESEKALVMEHTVDNCQQLEPLLFKHMPPSKASENGQASMAPTMIFYHHWMR